MKKKVDRVIINRGDVAFVSEDDDSFAELIVGKNASFTFAYYSKKDMRPLEIEFLE